MGSVLEQQARPFIQVADGLALEDLATRYSFMDMGDYSDLLHRDVGQAMKVYWSETLERAHIAAVTATLRSRLWLSALLSTEVSNNVLAFSAAFRGLLESAADTTTSLLQIPISLAQNYPLITDALSGSASKVAVSKELEDELIHYSHGRFVNRSERDSTPKPHRARSVHEYLKVFENLNANKVAECYRWLCDLTHPGAPSVLMWLVPLDDEGSELMLSKDPREAMIANFLSQYESVLHDVLTFAFNPPVLVLNTLNYFPIKKLHTQELLKYSLDSIAAWKNCRNELERRGAQVQVTAQ